MVGKEDDDGTVDGSADWLGSKEDVGRADETGGQEMQVTGHRSCM